MKLERLNKAFSLVELSIVLVILGLLTGGILAGQSLIRAAEIRAVTAEYTRWISATQTFRDKYMGLPGDITTATRFWSRTANVASCVTNSSASVVAPGTCDGDGDGALEPAGAVSTSGEMFQYWNQLAQAGLIEGTYSGYTTASRVDGSMPGTNVASSRISNAVWMVRAGSLLGGSINSYTTLGNTLAIGIANTAGSSNGDAPAIKAEEAWNIDTKLDDGKPGYGKVQTYNATSRPSCVSTDVASTSAYLLTDTSLGCNLLFPNAF